MNLLSMFVKRIHSKVGLDTDISRKFNPCQNIPFSMKNPSIIRKYFEISHSKCNTIF